MPQEHRDEAHDDIAATIASQERNDREGEVSVYTCPDCGGTLLEVHDEEGRSKFACPHLGHEFTPDALVVAKSHILQRTVSEAMRMFKEHAVLLRQLAIVVDRHPEQAGGLIQQAEQYDEHARLLKSHLLEGSDQHPSMDESADITWELVRAVRRPADD